MSRRLPRGRVTFAFVDVVGSTRIFAEHGDAFVEALALLQERIARRTLAADGVVVKTEGDGAFLAFGSAESAVRALTELQDELAQGSGDVVLRLAVRAGAHSGDAAPVAGDYVALAVHVAARVAATAGPGQVVVSAAVQAELPGGLGVCVGDYDLKDVADPVELWRVHGDDTPLRGTPSRRTNVRVPITGFVGRAKELAELGELISRKPMVTVLGPGGLGKTRLVSELVLQVAGDVPGGAWLVELSSASAGDQALAALGHVLGVHGGDVSAITAEVRRRGEVLLVLDNCEHLVDVVADLADDLLHACPEARVLCTSREPLQVADEHVWPLSPFSGQAARLELFTQRAWASGADVPDDSAAAVDRLCTALDGLPLAIELAATQARSSTLEELIRIAEQGTEDLTRRGGEGRQRSLEAVLSWSLDCLPAPRRAALLVLSVLPGRFDLEMATTILGEVEACETDAVRPLTRASLIDLDGESYRILDTIRHAARRQLARESDLARAARLGLRAWAQGVAAARYRVRDRFDEMPADQVLALEAALEQAMHDNAAGIGKLWELVRLISVYRDPSARVVDLAGRFLSCPPPSDADEALCFACAVDVLLKIGALPVPDSLLESLCTAADEHGMSHGQADLHFRLVDHYCRTGDVASARRHAEAYFPFGERPEADWIDRRYARNARIIIAAVTGDLEELLKHAEQDLAEARASGTDLELDFSENNLASVLRDLGRADEALPHAVEAVRLSPRPGWRRRTLLVNLARTQFALGDTEAALTTAHALEAELGASGLSPERVQDELDQLQDAVPAFAPAGATPPLSSS